MSGFADTLAIGSQRKLVFFEYVSHTARTDKNVFFFQLLAQLVSTSSRPPNQACRTTGDIIRHEFFENFYDFVFFKGGLPAPLRRMRSISICFDKSSRRPRAMVFTSTPATDDMRTSPPRPSFIDSRPR
jgi:hypothetical protein